MKLEYQARILLIDDDRLVSETLSAILRRAGYAVTTAANGEAGLNEMRSHDFDIVITDIMMPQRDGIEIIIEIRQNYPSQKVVAISGGSLDVNVDYLEFAEKLGADGILRKPIYRAQLLAMVEPLIRQPR